MSENPAANAQVRRCLCFPSTSIHVLLFTLLMLFHPQAGENDKMNEWVRLTSTDGYEFLVKRKVAACSGTLRNSLSAESQSLFHLRNKHDLQK